jgi:hypothetical protein
MESSKIFLRHPVSFAIFRLAQGACPGFFPNLYSHPGQAPALNETGCGSTKISEEIVGRSMTRYSKRDGAATILINPSSGGGAARFLSLGVCRLCIAVFNPQRRDAENASSCSLKRD